MPTIHDRRRRLAGRDDRQPVDINDLRQQRQQRATSARALLDRAQSAGRDMSEVEERQFDRLMDEADAFEEQIRDAEQDRERTRRDLERGGGAHRDDGVWFTTDTGQRLRGVRHGESFARAAGHGAGMDEEDLSLGRALMALITGDRSLAEREFRAQVIAQDPAGGMFITPQLGGVFIDLARARSVLSSAGAITIPLRSAETRIVKVDSDPVAKWKAELSALNNTQVSFGAVQMFPKVLGCVADISEELVEDGANAPEVIEQVMAQAVADQLDRSFFRGFNSGVEGTLHQGVIDDPDVNVVDVGVNGVAPSAATGWNWYVDAIQKVEDANGPATVRIDSPRTAASFGKLKDTTNQPLMMPESVAALRSIRSTQVPVNMTHGSANNASPAVVGDFGSAFVILGIRAEFRVEVSAQAGNAWENLGRKIRVWGRADMAIGRPAHLTVIKGILP